MDFVENLTIELPKAQEQVASFQEKEYRQDHGLIIELAAIHSGLTGNYNNYSAEEIEKSLATWVEPYPKPIILNHDTSTNPMGRIMAAKMGQEADGTKYAELQAAVSDPQAVSRIMDQRYLTGSVGGSASEAICSICETDWANASMERMPCKHSRGKTYKGKLCYFDMRGITWKEYSFVNVPGDQRSSIRNYRDKDEQAETNENEWTHSARIFSLDMTRENIMKLDASQDNKNILESMNKKEATPVYMNLKGAFLSTLAFSEAESSEDTDKESNVTEDLETAEEDVLAVASQLSTDLEESAEAVEEEEVVEDAQEVEEEETPKAEEEEVVSEDAEDVEEDVETKPEGQEKPNQELPVSREEEVDAEDGVETSEQKEEETEEIVESEGLAAEEREAFEARIKELEDSQESLQEQNTQLKAALKRGLAERVVDMKIALGMTEAEERKEAIEEHAGRSAASLADSIRDLSSIKPEKSKNVPQVEETSAALSDKDEPTVVEGEEVEEEQTEEEGEKKVEEYFTKLLRGGFQG